MSLYDRVRRASQVIAGSGVSMAELEEQQTRAELTAVLDDRFDVAVVLGAIEWRGFANQHAAGRVAVELAKCGLAATQIAEALPVIFHTRALDRIDLSRALARAELLAVMVNTFGLSADRIYLVRIALGAIESRAGELR